MPIERPSLPELIDQGAAEFESRLPGVLVRVRNSLIGVVNRVFAGGVSSLYQYVEWRYRQAWPDQSDAEELDNHGARWGVARNPATGATGLVQFTGAEGAAVPVGTVLRRADGVQYITSAAGVIAVGQVQLAVRGYGDMAVGQTTNAAVGLSLQLITPISGVNATATASNAMAGGADAEADEPYRARILRRIRQVPHGGSALDYEAWMLQVPGVTRAWVYPSEQGPGTVVLRFMRDDDATATPDAGEVASVQAVIDRLRPVTAQAIVVAPQSDGLNLTITTTPVTAAVRNAIAGELRELLRREAEPGGTLLISHIREAISSAAGEIDHVLTVPSGNVVSPAGHILVLGAITWL